MYLHSALKSGGFSGGSKISRAAVLGGWLCPSSLSQPSTRPVCVSRSGIRICFFEEFPQELCVMPVALRAQGRSSVARWRRVGKEYRKGVSRKGDFSRKVTVEILP